MASFLSLVLGRLPDNEAYRTEVVILRMSKPCSIDPDNFFTLLEDLEIAPLLFVRHHFEQFVVVFILELELRDPEVVACATDFAYFRPVDFLGLDEVFVRLDLCQELWGAFAIRQMELQTANDCVNLITLLPGDGSNFDGFVEWHRINIFGFGPLIIGDVLVIVIVAEDWQLAEGLYSFDTA